MTTETAREDDVLGSVLTPPDNFAMVDKGIYRSAFPTKKSFPFLKRLHLKTVVYLCPEAYPSANLQFLDSIGARLLQFGLTGNKEPFVDIPEDLVNEAIPVILSKDNHPLLIHCNKGKHRTGCIVGCLRKVHRWSMTSVFEEYRRFAHPKERFMDQQFIELWTYRPRPLPQQRVERVGKSVQNGPVGDEGGGGDDDDDDDDEEAYS